jgi:hypothetical protein
VIALNSLHQLIVLLEIVHGNQMIQLVQKELAQNITHKHLVTIKKNVHGQMMENVLILLLVLIIP